MTEQEKKMERANLFLELEDATSDLVHLRERAFRFAKCLRDAAAKIESSAREEPSGNDFTAEGDLMRRLDPRSQEALNYDAAVKLIEELKTARQNLYNLNLRKSSLASAGSIRI
jgi:hypothetical protein